MRCEVTVPPALASVSFYNVPGSLLPSIANASSALSLWSEASYQPADESSAYKESRCTLTGRFLNNDTDASGSGAPELASELRRNPRRTAANSQGRLAAPPALVRQSDRKVNFVDNLVDSATQIVEAIWPLSSIICRGDLGTKAVLPLRTFIQETLRRSRTSYSTLQVALYYLILVKPHVRASQHNLAMEPNSDGSTNRTLHCGRRMFLSALILASKYLQDRNYSARAWSKISGLNTAEINQNEVAFLLAVDWELHVPDSIFSRWTGIVLKHTPRASPPSSPTCSPTHLAKQVASWKDFILKLEPDLSNIESLLPLSTPSYRESDLSVTSPRSILNVPPLEPRPALTLGSLNSQSLAALQLSNSVACGESLLPTPRLTPQTSDVCTPAVGAAAHGHSRNSSMPEGMPRLCLKMPSGPDRWGDFNTSSPQRHGFVRRPSLAHSASTASSPESMVSDSSRVSSLSSVSSLGSAGHHIGSSGRCGVYSRFPVARRWYDKPCGLVTVASVPEEAVQPCLQPSPPDVPLMSAPRLKNLSLDISLARRPSGLGGLACDAMSEAAKALQELREESTMHVPITPVSITPSSSLGHKRGRSASMEKATFPGNMRDMLARRGDIFFARSPWSEDMAAVDQLAALSDTMTPSKRVCCSAEAATDHSSTSGSFHPAFSMRESRMWDGILN